MWLLIDYTYKETVNKDEGTSEIRLSLNWPANSAISHSCPSHSVWDDGRERLVFLISLCGPSLLCVSAFASIPSTFTAGYGFSGDDPLEMMWETHPLFGMRREKHQKESFCSAKLEPCFRQTTCLGDVWPPGIGSNQRQAVAVLPLLSFLSFCLMYSSE